jgi:hypothetical protein
LYKLFPNEKMLVSADWPGMSEKSGSTKVEEQTSRSLLSASIELGTTEPESTPRLVPAYYAINEI